MTAGPKRITPAQSPAIIVHRTMPEHTDENSLHGIELSANSGADAVEIDVRRTRDGRIPVLHDRSLNRVARGGWWLRRRPVRTHSAKSLAKARLRQTGEPVPFLEETAAALGRSQMLAIEIKDSGAAAEVLRLVREGDLNGRVIVWSYSESVVKFFARQAPEIETSLLRNSKSQAETIQFIQDAVTLGAGGVSLPWLHVNPETMSLAHRHGLRVYSLIPKSHLGGEIFWLLDGVITDWPAEAIAARNLGPPPQTIG